LTEGHRIKNVLIVIIPALMSAMVGCQDPPLSTLEKADFALKSAAAGKARIYAEPQYRQAEELLRKGQLEIARQKGRLAPFRNYHAADSILNVAYTVANLAADEARGKVVALRSKAENELGNLRDELAVWKEALNGSLQAITAGRDWSKADLALKMSERLVGIGEYESAIESIEKGKESLVQLAEVIAQTAEDEKREIKNWRIWVNETLKESIRSGSPAIIVDKSAHKLYLVKGGKLAFAFDCELGYNSARQKLFSGDGATPEGKYQITSVRHNGSKFYKALAINYPNAHDKRIFSENKSKGIISRRARIGAFIEIHGDGGKMKDWTNGCVALANNDIDRLMKHVSTGTPVTIVRRSDRWP